MSLARDISTVGIGTLISRVFAYTRDASDRRAVRHRAVLGSLLRRAAAGQFLPPAAGGGRAQLRLRADLAAARLRRGRRRQRQPLHHPHAGDHRRHHRRDRAPGGRARAFHRGGDRAGLRRRAAGSHRALSDDRRALYRGERAGGGAVGGALRRAPRHRRHRQHRGVQHGAGRAAVLRHGGDVPLFYLSVWLAVAIVGAGLLAVADHRHGLACGAGGALRACACGRATRAALSTRARCPG